MTHFCSLRYLFISVSAAIFGTATLASAQDAADNQAMLVLDASGSMWGKIGDETKIEIARDVIDELVTTWDAETPLGLMAYGHRKKGDCSDIEILQTPAPIDPSKFSKQVNALNPTGKTPMVQSVIDAAEALSYEDQKSTVILVSDGEETCGLDPCEIGKSLKAKGVDFTAHVIGFDVSLSESAGMRCLADETGGRYMDAENAEELSEAMVIAAEDTTSSKDYEDVPGPATVNVIPETVMGGSSFEIKWTGPQNRRDRLVITSADGKTYFNGRFVDTKERKSPSTLRAPETPGEYQVHYITRVKTSLAFDSFTILPAKAIVDAPDTDIVGGSRFDVKVSAPNHNDDKLAIYNSSGEKVETWTIKLNYQNGIKTILAPEEPGTYQVKYLTREGNVLASDEITVIAAKAFLTAPDDTIVGGADFSVRVSAPNSHKDKINIYDQNGKRLQSWTVSRWIKNGEMTIRAPEEPGVYSVNFTSGDKQILASDDITVIAATAEIDAPNGLIKADSRFTLKVSDPNSNNEKIGIVNAEGKRIKSWTVSRWIKNGEMTLTAPKDPGTYELIYYTGERRILARDSLTVVAE